ncbi:MAG: hypothetical protein ACKVP3_17300 [Hyphomicrobiaceae bacterium]
MAQKNQRSPKKRAAFLEALAAGLSISEAAKSAAVGLRTVYTWRKEDTKFADDWDEAYAQGAETLDAEAFRRAVTGTLRPVFNRGVRAVDHDGTPAAVREFSDTLLIVLMKARNPERYCERARTAALMRRWAKDDAADRAGADKPDADIVALLNRIAGAKAANA